MEENLNQNIAKAKRKDESRNRKGKLELIAVLIVLALLGGAMIYEFIWAHVIEPYAIKDLNNNIELPYEFGAEADKYDVEQEWIGDEDEEDMVFYIDKSNGDAFQFARYPDYADSVKFTSFYTCNKEVELYGFKVGDSSEKADKQLKEHGYKCIDISGGYYNYERGRINISFNVSIVTEENNEGNSFTEERVVEYWVELASTDKQRKGNYK
ncbi:hypothetical protein SAMN02746066_01252 [Anaerosporobacter mobilis DSM 15930]|jgi:hypothetical protein|uniref:Uncharacterized protein n=1 Tax=Anaerosporobacter mobilis DSM 15930 TaxID=1120996 RepID=A0A1M7H2M2_9FIRM|nr:hypothetical protein [Anaerosporobacter mobilis]SHM22633.1 hypothetical protein SAMN02746066_01252 [Anaerosporobacter mobilis DSM 15930]